MHWIFIPGGPGLGSESLKALTSSIKLPGTIWHLDLPGDGSNIENEDPDAFSKWQEGLIEAVQVFGKVIIVGHSMGGMYTLATPQIKDHLAGLVLLDTAPHAGWQQSFADYCTDHPIPGLNELQQKYVEQPNNETIKEMTLLSVPYCSEAADRVEKFSFLQTLPYNYQACDWSGKHFDPFYEALWFPDNLPTLIMAGEQDRITPLKFFKESKDFDYPHVLYHARIGL
jgi:pimeloyl-ACP methyl ester carboxylesterase